jgi:solute:Na+ symporter, SSS family
MYIHLIDWIIIAIFLLSIIGISLYMSRRAGKNTGEFFLSGRKLPWFIAGTSMVATTFAADTPLAVTELVAQNGIAGNWLWWNMLFGGMLTVFFFARLWRRSNIMTDAEFVSIRYSGNSARFLRGFRAVYIGIFMNAIVMAWVNLAMVKILKVMFPELTLFGISSVNILGLTFSSHLLVVGIIMILVASYTALSGLWGVSITDTFQFIIAMGGSILLAIMALRHIGGAGALQEQLSHVGWVFDFMPVVSGSGVDQASGLLQMTVVALVAYLGVQWWASWYPGSEPGGGGYVAQRMMSAKDEKHSLLATLWFQVAHFALRPWPWIIVALVALVLYPHEADKGATYVMVIRDLAPRGVIGLLLAGFFAAYMSTMASQTVWGASYIINDLYRPFIKPDATEKYYVKISRLTTVLLIFFSLIITTQFEQISDAWRFILACSAGIGLVLLLRWYWWRINAWSEISAMLAPYAVYPLLVFYFDLSYEAILLIIVAWSTLVWISVTFLTRPSSNEKLLDFFRRVHPGGPGWKPVASQLPDVQQDKGLGNLLINYICGCFLVMFSLFGIGRLIFGQYLSAGVYLGVAAVAAAVIYLNLSRAGWEKVIK